MTTTIDAHSHPVQMSDAANTNIDNSEKSFANKAKSTAMTVGKGVLDQRTAIASTAVYGALSTINALSSSSAERNGPWIGAQALTGATLAITAAGIAAEKYTAEHIPAPTSEQLQKARHYAKVATDVFAKGVVLATVGMGLYEGVQTGKKIHEAPNAGDIANMTFLLASSIGVVKHAFFKGTPALAKWAWYKNPETNAA